LYGYLLLERLTICGLVGGIHLFFLLSYRYITLMPFDHWRYSTFVMTSCYTVFIVILVVIRWSLMMIHLFPFICGIIHWSLLILIFNPLTFTLIHLMIFYSIHSFGIYSFILFICDLIHCCAVFITLSMMPIFNFPHSDPTFAFPLHCWRAFHSRYIWWPHHTHSHTFIYYSLIPTFIRSFDGTFFIRFYILMIHSFHSFIRHCYHIHLFWSFVFIHSLHSR